jgi:hypothetical protein
MAQPTCLSPTTLSSFIISMTHIASSCFFWLGHLPCPKMHAVLYLQSVAQIIERGGWVGGQWKLQQQQQQQPAVEYYLRTMRSQSCQTLAASLLCCSTPLQKLHHSEPACC